MTWKEIKDQVEEQGVTDDMEVKVIDLWRPEYVNVRLPKKDPKNGVWIS